MHKDVIHPRLSLSSWWAQHWSKKKIAVRDGCRPTISVVVTWHSLKAQASKRVKRVLRLLVLWMPLIVIQMEELRESYNSLQVLTAEMREPANSFDQRDLWASERRVVVLAARGWPDFCSCLQRGYVPVCCSLPSLWSNKRKRCCRTTVLRQFASHLNNRTSICSKNGILGNWWHCD